MFKRETLIESPFFYASRFENYRESILPRPTFSAKAKTFSLSDFGFTFGFFGLFFMIIKCP